MNSNLFFLFIMILFIGSIQLIEARRKPPRDYGQILPAEKPMTTKRPSSSGSSSSSRPNHSTSFNESHVVRPNHNQKPKPNRGKPKRNKRPIHEQNHSNGNTFQVSQTTID